MGSRLRFRAVCQAIQSFSSHRHFSSPLDSRKIRHMADSYFSPPEKGKEKSKFSRSPSVTLISSDRIARFAVDQQNGVKVKEKLTRVNKSKRAKLKELRFFRLKAKKKLKSPNPEVRIKYKLQKVLKEEQNL